MHTEVLLVASAHRLPRIRCIGAVTARCTGHDTVHLVSTAATPLGGDTIDIRVIVERGGQLRLRSAAATVALPGTENRTSHAHWEIDVAGSLDVDLEPTVVAATARHMSGVVLRLHDDGQVRLRERVQIGRYNEREGFWSGSMRADVGDYPLLRHRVELGAGSVTDDVVWEPRATINELRCPSTAFAVDVDPGSTVLALAGGGTLSTWQGERLTARPI